MSDSKRKPTRGDGKPQERSEINLAVPWGSDYPQSIKNYASRRFSRLDNSFGTPSEDALGAFITERTRLHETYIKEQERTKRIGMIVAATLIVAAAALVLFAPAGRETLSYWIGAALVIFASGSMGYQRIWGKSKNLSFGADQDRHDLERQ